MRSVMKLVWGMLAAVVLCVPLAATAEELASQAGYLQQSMVFFKIGGMHPANFHFHALCQGSVFERFAHRHVGIV